MVFIFWKRYSFPRLNSIGVCRIHARLAAKFNPMNPTDSYVYSEVVEKVKRSGFDGLLEKPLQGEVLYNIIEGIMHEKISE